MAPQGDYFPDHERGILWIIIPKCASTSLDITLGTDGHRVHAPEALEYSDYFTVVFVRHPWQRLVSAVQHPLQTGGTVADRIRKHVLEATPGLENIHVRPMANFTAPFRLDAVFSIESMQSAWNRLGEMFDLPELVWENKKGGPSWTEVNFPWSELEPRYYRDFELYERTGQIQHDSERAAELVPYFVELIEGLAFPDSDELVMETDLTVPEDLRKDGYPDFYTLTIPQMRLLRAGTHRLAGVLGENLVLCAKS